jgi:hypothetical protein
MEFDLRLHAGTRSKVLVTDYPDDTINPAKGRQRAEHTHSRSTHWMDCTETGSQR